MKTDPTKVLYLASVVLLASSLVILILYTFSAHAQEKKTVSIQIEPTPCGKAASSVIGTFVGAALLADDDYQKKTINEGWYGLMTGSVEGLIKHLQKQGPVVPAYTAWVTAHSFMIFVLENLDTGMVMTGKSAEMFIKAQAALHKIDPMCAQEKAEKDATPPKKKNNVVKL